MPDRVRPKGAESILSVALIIALVAMLAIIGWLTDLFHKHFRKDTTVKETKTGDSDDSDRKRAWEYYKHADALYFGRINFFLVAESMLVVSLVTVSSGFHIRLFIGV